MTLYTVTNGNVTDALDVDQYYQLLTGTMTDQQVTVSNRIRAQLSGASAATGYVGGNTAGPPTSGTFAVGDLALDQNASAFGCVSAGTPGSWRSVGTALIGSQTLGATTATVTFSSIPQYFSHLLLVLTARSTQASNFDDARLTFNGSSAGYTWVNWFSQSSNGATGSVAYDQGLTQANILLATIPAATIGSSSISGSATVYIPHYTNTSWGKNVQASSWCVQANLNSTAQRYGGWTSTAAVTSLALTCSASFAAGSSFHLYGLP